MRRNFFLFIITSSILANAARAAEPQTVSSLSYESAAKILGGSLEAAQEKDRHVAIVIIDSNGAIITSARMDSAKPVSMALAAKKAKTALLFRGSSRSAMEEINAGAYALLSLDDLAALPGGLALRKGGEYLGAIGVSGAPADIDEKIAAAGLKALEE